MTSKRPDRIVRHAGNRRSQSKLTTTVIAFHQPVDAKQWQRVDSLRSMMRDWRLLWMPRHGRSLMSAQKPRPLALLSAMYVPDTWPLSFRWTPPSRRCMRKSTNDWRRFVGPPRIVRPAPSPACRSRRWRCERRADFGGCLLRQHLARRVAPHRINRWATDSGSVSPSCSTGLERWRTRLGRNRCQESISVQR